MAVSGTTYRVLDRSGEFVADYDNEFYARAVAKVIGGLTDEIPPTVQRAGSKTSAPIERGVYFLTHTMPGCRPFIHGVYQSLNLAEVEARTILDEEDGEVSIDYHSVTVRDTKKIKKLYVVFMSDTPDDMESYWIHSLHTAKSDTVATAKQLAGGGSFHWVPVSSGVMSQALSVDGKFSGMGMDEYYVTRSEK